ncbi:hypothetical protein MUU53_18630 [Rhizobium lemnae]|uniref:Transposase n=1 Tax=Rhizobium lemnae TaxID=1214924 RepID=A0ABV8EC38_9HYPH|nr:hypothetical protein [Rhizobium lemnae]MCJ8509919.1 hypothetical protein [Rhizobium lemnae]
MRLLFPNGRRPPSFDIRRASGLPLPSGSLIFDRLVKAYNFHRRTQAQNRIGDEKMNKFPAVILAV